MLISTPPPPFPLPSPLTATTPPPPSPPPASDLLSDIFSSSPSPPPSQSPAPHDLDPHHNTHPSDIPRLRSQHSTAGYRDGLAASKTPALQPGFDEGYTLGAVLGLQVGELRGVLEGVCAALHAGQGAGKRGGDGTAGRSGSGSGGDTASGTATNAQPGVTDHASTAYERIAHLRRRAAVELDLQRVFGKEFWGDEGLWRWAVPAVTGGGAGHGLDGGQVEREGDEVTFEEVAAAHPLVRKWRGVVEEVMREWGVERGVWAGEEWEAGRVGGEGA
ncbi:hypothetical protein MMC18_009542 [Xylographa bjoerkii]|nr:hypothetical protein [Xylographa bjoerkii]